MLVLVHLMALDNPFRSLPQLVRCYVSGRGVLFLNRPDFLVIKTPTGWLRKPKWQRKRQLTSLRLILERRSSFGTHYVSVIDEEIHGPKKTSLFEIFLVKRDWLYMVSEQTFPSDHWWGTVRFEYCGLKSWHSGFSR